jgi:hypothetical protein
MAFSPFIQFNKKHFERIEGRADFANSNRIDPPIPILEPGELMVFFEFRDVIFHLEWRANDVLGFG